MAEMDADNSGEVDFGECLEYSLGAQVDGADALRRGFDLFNRDQVTNQNLLPSLITKMSRKVVPLNSDPTPFFNPARLLKTNSNSNSYPTSYSGHG